LIFYIKPDPWKSNFIQPSERSKYKYTPSGIPYDLSQSSISDNIFCYQEKYKKRKEGKNRDKIAETKRTT